MKNIQPTEKPSNDKKKHSTYKKHWIFLQRQF